MANLWELLEMRRCFGCSKTGEYFCKRCTSTLVTCKRSLQTELKLTVLANQNPALMRAISAWKDNHIKKLTGVFCDLMLEKIDSLKVGTKSCVVTPPIRKEAYKHRGFNPLVDLAKELCKRNPNLEFAGSILGLQRAIKDQRTLNFENRKANLHEAFKCLDVPVVPIILLDDVVTSGATLLEMRRALVPFGQPIQAIALASSHNLFALKNHR